MEKYIIERHDNVVECRIMYDKKHKKYRWVNLTHNHICPCEFNTIDDAIFDLDLYVGKGEVVKYIRIDE